MTRRYSTNQPPYQQPRRPRPYGRPAGRGYGDDDGAVQPPPDPSPSGGGCDGHHSDGGGSSGGGCDAGGF